MYPSIEIQPLEELHSKVLLPLETLVSLVMGLVLLLKWVVKACQPEDEYPWAVTYRGLLERDEESQNHL